jgi:hypothetical protein
MNKKLAILTLILITITASVVKGQISVTLGPRMAKESFSSKIPVYVGEPEKQSFSTAQLSKQYPGSKIKAEILNIGFPKMPGAIDTLGILWYLTPENYSAKGEVNVILIGISADSTKTFYIDNDNNRIFSDNEESFVFKPEVEKKILEIKILGVYSNYTLMNPDYYIAPAPPSKIGFYNETWKKSSKKPALTLDFEILTGGGNAQIDIKPYVTNITSYQYLANIFGCFRPSAGLGFSWYNIHLGISGDYELLQYESTVRYDYSDKFKTLRHFDLGWWTRTKVHCTLYAEYDIHLFNKVYFTPYASYSWDSNIDERRFEKTVDPNSLPADADYKDMHSEQYGFKIKLPVAEKAIVYLKTSYSRAFFDATDYLPAFEEGSYKIDYTQIYFGVGMNYRLTK